MMKKTFWAIMMACVSGLALVSCGDDDSQDKPSEKTSVPYAVIAESASASYFYTYVNEYHTNLYPVFREYLDLIDEVNKKYGDKYTVEVESAGKYDSEVNQEADKLALPVMKARYDEAMALINKRMAEISAKLKSVSPNEYEQLTAQLSHSIQLSLWRRPGDTFYKEQLEKKSSDEVLEYNTGVYAMKEYSMQNLLSLSGAFKTENTPKAFEAFKIAKKAIADDLDARLAAVVEGNCSTNEYIVMKTKETTLASMDDNAKKVYAKRMAAMAEWAAGVKELFLSKLNYSSIPQSELDQLDLMITVNPVVTSPFSECPKCGYIAESRGGKHDGCDNTKFEVHYIFAADAITIDVFKKK